MYWNDDTKRSHSGRKALQILRRTFWASALHSQASSLPIGLKSLLISYRKRSVINRTLSEGKDVCQTFGNWAGTLFLPPCQPSASCSCLFAFDLVLIRIYLSIWFCNCSDTRPLCSGEPCCRFASALNRQIWYDSVCKTSFSSVFMAYSSDTVHKEDVK